MDGVDIEPTKFGHGESTLYLSTIEIFLGHFGYSPVNAFECSCLRRERNTSLWSMSGNTEISQQGVLLIWSSVSQGHRAFATAQVKRSALGFSNC